MKILYLVHQFYPEYYSGTEKIILNLARMAQKYGHKVKVLTYSFYEPSFYDHRIGRIAIKEFTYRSVPVLAFRYRKLPKDIHYGFENSELSAVAAELIRRENPDVVHVGHSMRVGPLISAANQARIPYIVTLTDFFLICPKYTLLRSNGDLCRGPDAGRACEKHCPDVPAETIPQRLAIARDFLAGAQLVVAPSHFLAQMFQKEFGPSLRIEVVRYGLSRSGLTHNSRRYKSGDPVVFGYAGSLNSHKGVHILLEAFASVRSQNTSLRIYGDKGAEETYVSTLKEMARNDGRIEFRGRYASEQLGDVLNGIDVLVTPSLWHENNPLIVSEALASNVPVIVSDVGGMTEIVKHNYNGFVFPMGNSVRLREVLESIIDNPEVLNTMKGNLREMVFSTTEQEAYAYERIYDQVRLAG